MKNIEIYNLTTALMNAFKETTQYLPMKLNFYLQKNKNILLAASQELEESRMKVIQNYGKLSDDGSQYIIPKEHLEVANQELNDLLNLEQDIVLYKVKLSDLPDDIKLTTGQMEAIMFMIDDEA